MILTGGMPNPNPLNHTRMVRLRATSQGILKRVESLTFVFNNHLPGVVPQVESKMVSIVIAMNSPAIAITKNRIISAPTMDPL